MAHPPIPRRRSSPSASPVVYGWSPNGKTPFINGKKCWPPLNKSGPSHPAFSNPGVTSAAPPARHSRPLRLFSVFICNLSPSTSESGLRDFFGDFSDLQAIDLPSNRTKSGKRMAFIHFASQSSADRSVSELNGKVLRGNRLLVTRSTRAPPAQTAHRSGNLGPVLHHPRFPPPSPPLPPPPPFRPPTCQTRSTPLNPNPSPSATTPNLIPPSPCMGTENSGAAAFLSNYLFGVAHSDEDLDAIRADFAMDEIFDVSIISLGNRIFLLSFESSSFPERFGDEAIPFLEKWFSIIPNSANLVDAGGFYKWISIEGIPFSAWSDKTISDIASKFGSLIHIHPQSHEGSHRNSAYALIHRASSKHIKTSSSLSFKGLNHQIKVSEIRSSKVPVVQNWESDDFQPSASLPPHPRSPSLNSPEKVLEDGEIELSPIKIPSFTSRDHVSASDSGAAEVSSSDTHADPAALIAHLSSSDSERTLSINSQTAPPTKLTFRQALLSNKPSKPSKPNSQAKPNPSSSTASDNSKNKEQAALIRSRSSPNLSSPLPAPTPELLPSSTEFNADLAEAQDAWKLCKGMGFKSKASDHAVVLQFQKILRPSSALSSRPAQSLHPSS